VSTGVRLGAIETEISSAPHRSRGAGSGKDLTPYEFIFIVLCNKCTKHQFIHLLTATLKNSHIENSKNYKKWYCPHHTDCASMCCWIVSQRRYIKDNFLLSADNRKTHRRWKITLRMFTAQSPCIHVIAPVLASCFHTGSLCSCHIHVVHWHTYYANVTLSLRTFCRRQP